MSSSGPIPGGDSSKKTAKTTTPETELDGLPPPNVRWIPRRKAQVLSAISRGLIDVEAVCARYALSEEELASWRVAANSREGLGALRITRLVQHRRESLGGR